MKTTRQFTVILLLSFLIVSLLSSLHQFIPLAWAKPDSEFWFGWTKQNSVTSPSNVILGTNFTFIDNVAVTVNCSGIHMTGMYQYSSGDEKYKYALYDANLNLLASTSEYVGKSGGQRLNFSTSQILTNNTVYWLVCWETSWALYYSSYNLFGSMSFNLTGQTYNGTFPSSLSPTSYSQSIWQIHAYYTTTEILIDSFTPTTDDGFGLAALHPSSSIYSSAAGETFKVTSGNYTLTKVSFKMGTTESPIGTDARVRLYVTTGTFGVNATPTGSPLATATPTVDLKQIRGDYLLEWAWQTFQFQDGFVLENGTVYAIVWENPTSGTIDTDNYVVLDLLGAGGYAGNSFRYTNGEWNVSCAAPDCLFYLYGVPIQHSVTFRYTSDGTFLVNGTSKANGTSTLYDESSVLNLSAVPSIHYGFMNFTWNGSSSSSNYTLVTVTSNLTIWCYFGLDPYVTFYMNDGTFKVNGTSKSNGTQTQYAVGTVLSLAGSGWSKWYVFGNFTFLGGSSESNPYNFVLTVEVNQSIWLYNQWSPSSYPPDFPSTPSGLQYLINGDYLGFINSSFTSLIGDSFYAFGMVVIYLMFYLRTKSLAICSIAWTLLGGLCALLIPMISTLAVIFWAIGIAGILFTLLGKGSEN